MTNTGGRAGAEVVQLYICDPGTFRIVVTCEHPGVDFERDGSALARREVYPVSYTHLIEVARRITARPRSGRTRRAALARRTVGAVSYTHLTGKEQKIRIEASSGLTEQEIQRMRDEAKANEAKDKEEKERIDKINAADSNIFATEKQLKEMCIRDSRLHSSI